MKEQKVLHSVHPTSLLALPFPELQLRMIPVLRALVTFAGAALPLPWVILEFWSLQGEVECWHSHCSCQAEDGVCVHTGRKERSLLNETTPVLNWDVKNPGVDFLSSLCTNPAAEPKELQKPLDGVCALGGFPPEGAVLGQLSQTQL